MALFLLSVGALDALVPVLLIIILIGAAAGLTRGFSFLDLFGVSTFMGIMGKKGKATLAKSTSSKDIIDSRRPQPMSVKKIGSVPPESRGAAQVGGSQSAQVEGKPPLFSINGRALSGTPNIPQNRQQAWTATKKGAKWAVKGPLLNTIKPRRTVTPLFRAAGKTPVYIYKGAQAGAKVLKNPKVIVSAVTATAAYRGGKSMLLTKRGNLRRPEFADRVVRRARYNTNRKIKDTKTYLEEYGKKNAVPPELRYKNFNKLNKRLNQLNRRPGLTKRYIRRLSYRKSKPK